MTTAITTTYTFNCGGCGGEIQVAEPVPTTGVEPCPNCDGGVDFAFHHRHVGEIDGVRVHLDRWQVQEFRDGQWHDLGTVTTRFATAMRDLTAAPNRRLCRNGKPLRAPSEDPQPDLFQEEPTE